MTDLLPSHYQYVHQSGVRAISWIRAPPTSSSGVFRTDLDPTVIASGGHDGTECLWDIRDPGGNVMNRTRGTGILITWAPRPDKWQPDVIPSMPWSPYAGGPVTIDHENAVKAYSISPSMMGRGHLLLEPAGPVWVSRTSFQSFLFAHGMSVRFCVRVPPSTCGRVRRRIVHHCKHASLIAARRHGTFLPAPTLPARLLAYGRAPSHARTNSSW